MESLAVLNLILHNFLQAQISSITIFNCWHIDTLHSFSKMGMNKSFYMQYINLDNEDSTRYPVHRFLKRDQPRMGVFMDLNCNYSMDVLKAVSELYYFSEHFHWLLYDNNANIKDFQESFENMNISINADLTYIYPVNNKTSFIIYDVYNNGYHIGGKLNITIDREIICNDHNCYVKQYLSKLNLRSKYGNRETMRDVTLRVSTVVTTLPLNTTQSVIIEFLKTSDNIVLDNIARFGFVLIPLLQDMLHFNTNYILHNSWSDNEITGGIIGDIIEHKADFATSPYLSLKSRLLASTPITEFSVFRSVCVFRTPRNSGIKTNVFLEPFDTTVWILFAIVLVICAMLLWLTFVVEKHSLSKFLGFVPSLLTSLIISFGTACNQGSFLVPLSIGGRLTFLTLTVVCFLMYNYYTSIVVSSLLGSPVKSNIKTVKQLAESSLKIGMERLPYTVTYLNTSTLSDVKEFVKHKVKILKNVEDLWLPVIDGIVKLRDTPNFGYVFEASTGYVFVERLYEAHEICDLNEVPFRTGVLSQHVHINSTYREFFRLKLMRIMETGIHRKHFKHWIRSKPQCFYSNFVIQVGLEYTAPLFILLFCTFILVFLLLLLEIIYKRYFDVKIFK